MCRSARSFTFLSLLCLIILVAPKALWAVPPTLTNQLSLQEIQRLKAADLVSENGDFASSIAIDGNIIVVGSQGYAAHVYTYNTSTMMFDYAAKLTASDFDAATHYFAKSVAIDGDVVVVGSTGQDSNPGEVYVYEKPENGWGDMTQTVKLNNNGMGSDGFGTSLDIDNDIIVVGDPASTTFTGGAVLHYRKPDTGWADQVLLPKSTSLNGSFNYRFGSGVVLDGDVLVATSRDNSGPGPQFDGSAHVYKLNAITNDFIHQGELDPLQDIAGFGASVALDGDIIAVGISPFRSEGSVRLYEKAGNEWTDLNAAAVLTGSDMSVLSAQFGTSIDISGDTIYVGSANSVGSYKHAIYQFEKPYSGWEDMDETNQISFPVVDENYFVGQLVASSGGIVITNNRYKVGGNAYDAVIVLKEGVNVVHSESTKLANDFQSQQGTSPQFSLQGGADRDLFTINSATGVLSFKTAPDFETPEDADGDNLYEVSLNMSENSESAQYPVRITVGDLRYEGKAIDVKKFVADYAFSPNVDANSILGAADSIDIDGDTMVVGIQNYYVNSVRVGAAFVFELNSATGEFEQSAILTLHTPVVGEYLGYEVAISGDTVAVSVSNDTFSEAGSVYIFQKPDTGWEDMIATTRLQQKSSQVGELFGYSIDISGDTVVVTAPIVTVSEVSNVYVYTAPVGGWTVAGNNYEVAVLSTSVGMKNAFGGSVKMGSVAVDNNTIAVGAPYESDGTGLVFLYEKPSSGWANMTETGVKAATNHMNYDNFGQDVALDGGILAVGAPRDSSGSSNQSAIFVFNRPDQGWSQLANANAIFTQKTLENDDKFGATIALSNNTLVATTPDNMYLFDVSEGSGTEVDLFPAPESVLFRKIGVSGATLILGDDLGNNGHMTMYQATQSNVSPSMLMLLLN